MASEAISECLILKIFLGKHSPDPPNLFTPQWPYQSKIAGSGPDVMAAKTMNLACKQFVEKQFVKMEVIYTQKNVTQF